MTHALSCGAEGTTYTTIFVYWCNTVGHFSTLSMKISQYALKISQRWSSLLENTVRGVYLARGRHQANIYCLENSINKALSPRADQSTSDNDFIFYFDFPSEHTIYNYGCQS